MVLLFVDGATESHPGACFMSCESGKVKNSNSVPLPSFLVNNSFSKLFRGTAFKQTVGDQVPSAVML